ncbi:hypothetical protein EMMF5_005485 [Cystobasidiomycetes sp. EMM_F5]
MLGASLACTLLYLLGTTNALHEIQGGPCTGSEAWTYINGDGQTVAVQANCAPNGYCGDNGADCEHDFNCYNGCGTNFVCGGLSAYCQSRNPFVHTNPPQDDITCYTPGFVCSNDDKDGVCLLSASPAARHRQKARNVLAGLKFAHVGNHALAPAIEPIPANGNIDMPAQDAIAHGPSFGTPSLKRSERVRAARRSEASAGLDQKSKAGTVHLSPQLMRARLAAAAVRP